MIQRKYKPPRTSRDSSFTNRTKLLSEKQRQPFYFKFQPFGYLQYPHPSTHPRLSIRSSARPANRTDRLGPDTACCLQPTRARWPGDPASARANLGPAPDSPKHRAAHGTRSGQTRAAHGTRSRANLDRVRPDKPGSPRAPGPLSNGRKVLGEGPSFRTRRSSTSTTPRRSCKPLDGTNSGPSSSSSSSQDILIS